MRLNILLLPATLFAAAAAASSGTDVLSNWDVNSLKEFLSDFQIPFSDKETPQELVKKASAEWNIYTKPYSQWSLSDLKFYVQKKASSGYDNVVDNKEKVQKNVKQTKDKVQKDVKNTNDKIQENIKESKDQFVANIDQFWDDASDVYEDISSWAYKYWSKSELAKLVGRTKPGKSNTEKALDSVTHSQLVKEAQELSNKIANAGKTKQAYYPRAYLFKNLSTDDLKELLTSHSISFPEDADRKALIATLRKNLRSIYYEGQDKIVDVLTKLKIDSRDIYDKSGEIKHDIFKQWSQSDLESWLNNHELLPSVKNKKYTKDDLVKIAEDNSQTLKDDIDSYLAYKKKQVSPFLSKASDAVKDGYEKVSDSTYNLWSAAGHSHLQKVLNSQSERGKKLLQYIKDKTAPDSKKSSSVIENILPTEHTDYFNGWSVTELKEWLSEQGQAAAGTKDELVKSASSYLSNVLETARSTTSANAEATKKEACGYYAYFTNKLEIASNSANIWWLKFKNFILSYRI